MIIDILTLFPDSLSNVLGESIIGRAQKKNLVQVNCRQVRDYTENRQMQVDDYPYGGGCGCVMMAQPLADCLRDVLTSGGERADTRVIYMSPQGSVFNQETAKRLVKDYSRLVLVCGHYEGVDERFIEECVDEEISLGDFVVTGGEIPAMAIADAVCRLVPGVLADEDSFTGESHWDGLLEYPQYTRPEVWRDRRVPEILQSGNHAEIAAWRRRQSILRTMERRPDLFAKLEFTDRKDLEFLADLKPVEHKKTYAERRSSPDDIPAIMEVVADAQRFLLENGIDQWQDGYPTPDVFLADIANGESFVFTHEDTVAGIISVCSGVDSAYDGLVDGNWLTDGPYGAIHRIAVRENFRGGGLATHMAEFAIELCAGLGLASIRVDTHRDNKSMQGLMKKLGFTHCGVVYLDLSRPDGKARDAYEKVL